MHFNIFMSLLQYLFTKNITGSAGFFIVIMKKLKTGRLSVCCKMCISQEKIFFLL